MASLSGNARLADQIFANLVPILGLIVALIGVAIFRLSRRDRPIAAVVVVLGLAFIVLWVGAPEGAPPVGGTPSPLPPATPASRLPARGSA